MSVGGEPGEGATLSSTLEGAVLRFGVLVRSVGTRYGLDDADLDEVLQEVRIRLWRARGEVETLSSLGTSYVYSVARSACMDVLRRRRARRTGVEATRELSPDLRARGPDPAEALDRLELAQRVYSVVGRLSPNRRVVVRMYLAGHDRRGIARQLGWTVGKVRNLLSRGLSDLREILATEGIDGETSHG